MQIVHLIRHELAAFGRVGAFGDLADPVTHQATMQGPSAQLGKALIKMSLNLVQRQHRPLAELNHHRLFNRSQLGTKGLSRPIRESWVVDCERHLAMIFTFSL